jgi:CRISPR-associated protein Cas2
VSRRFYLVSYDVTDDRRRDRVYGLLLGYGDHVQFSVFCCQLNDREKVCLRRELSERINHDEDQALILDAGSVEGAKPEPEIECVGQPYTPRIRCQIV